VLSVLLKCWLEYINWSDKLEQKKVLFTKHM
jgi:hypothetical protein